MVNMARIEIGFDEDELRRFAMSGGLIAMENFVAALDEAMPTLMQRDPGAASGVAFARGLAVRMADGFRAQEEVRP